MINLDKPITMQDVRLRAAVSEELTPLQALDLLVYNGGKERLSVKRAQAIASRIYASGWMPKAPAAPVQGDERERVARLVRSGHVLDTISGYKVVWDSRERPTLYDNEDDAQEELFRLKNDAILALGRQPPEVGWEVRDALRIARMNADPIRLAPERRHTIAKLDAAIASLPPPPAASGEREGGGT